MILINEDAALLKRVQEMRESKQFNKQEMFSQSLVP